MSYRGLSYSDPRPFETLVPPSRPGSLPPMVTKAPTSAQGTTRAGFVLLAGLPNAGKSTLLNQVVGESLSIVTPKAQTTWQRVAGIRSEEATQMVFLDTPGVLVPGSLMQRSMMAEVVRASDDADVAVWVVDGTRRLQDAEVQLLKSCFDKVECPSAVVAAKSDSPGHDPGQAFELAATWGAEALSVSGLDGRGVESLLAWIRAGLPESPFLYDADDLASAPTRFFVEELVRETVFEQYHQEIPYAAVVRIDEFREQQDPVYIGATVYVERKSQKGIVVGKAGSGIKALGREARRKIEHFLGRSVYLDLWVKVWPGWRRKREGLQTLGFVVPDEPE